MTSFEADGILLVEECSPDNLEDEVPTSLSAFERFRRSKTLIFWVIALASFIEGLCYSIIIPIIPVYIESLQLSQVKSAEFGLKMERLRSASYFPLFHWP
jgi:hypothetical protein